MTDYIPKQNPTAEKQLLGWMILKCEFKDVDDFLFFDTNNKHLYQAMRKQWLRSGEINPYTIEEHVGLIADCQELSHPRTIEPAIEELEKLARHRKFCQIIMSAASEIEYSEESIDELLKETREKLSEVGSSSIIETYDH